jgi:hypothetical protein
MSSSNHFGRVAPSDGLRQRRPSGLPVEAPSSESGLEIDCVGFEHKKPPGEKEHTVYVVTIVRRFDGAALPTLRKRYSEFLELFEALGREDPSLLAAFYFPQKTYTGCNDKARRDRVLGFNLLVKRLAALPALPGPARDFFFPGDGSKGQAGGKVERFTTYLETPSPSSGGAGGGGAVAAGLQLPGGRPRAASSTVGVVDAVGDAEETKRSAAGGYGALCWHGDWSALRQAALRPETLSATHVGTLEVDLQEAFGLPAADFGLTSDPFCIATLTG